MGSSKTTKITNSSATKDPYAPAAPALQNIVTGATNAYNSGAGSGVYTGPRVAGLGDTSQAGLDMLAGSASAGQGAAKAGDSYLTGLLQNGGTTSGIQSALSGLDSIGKIDTSRISSIADNMADPNNLAYSTARALTRGDYNLSTSGYTGLLDSLSGQTQSEKSLQDAADGKFLGGANPYMDAVIGRSQGEAASKIAQSMGAAGRSGSGRYAATIADSLGAIGTEARYKDYDAERTRQMQAASQIDSSRNARTSLQQGLYGSINNAEQANAGLALSGAGLFNSTNTTALGGATALAGVDGQNIANEMQKSSLKLSAAQSDRAAAMAGLGMVGENIANLQQPGRTLAQIGSVQDQARQAQLDANQQQFSEQQASPWRALGLYSGIVDPIAQLGGTSSGTEVAQQNSTPSLLQQIMGTASAGVGILGQTGAFGAPAAAGAAGAGAAAGAGGAGWLSSLFALSDARAKENISEIGATHDGQPLYSYNYKGDATPQIGLMAQEVAQRDPSAVALTPDGLLMVDYARATAPSAALGERRRGLAEMGLAFEDPRRGLGGQGLAFGGGR